MPCDVFSLEFSFFLFCDKSIYFFIGLLYGMDALIVLTVGEERILEPVLKASHTLCLILIYILQFELIMTQYFITKAYI